VSDVHELKTDPVPFRHVVAGYKTFEYRREDRDYKLGDTLRLREFVADVSDNGKIMETGAYTGRSIDALVTYVTRGGKFGLPRGFCVMAIKVLTPLSQVGGAA
jgi:hypothetical protein